MSSSSEAAPGGTVPPDTVLSCTVLTGTVLRRTVLRGTVLRGDDTLAVRPARMDSELRTTAFAPTHAVDARLTDPHLERVVATARRAAEEQGRANGHAAGYAAGLAAAATEAAAAEQVRAAELAAAEAGREQRLSAALDVLEQAADACRRHEAVAVAEVEDVVTALALDVAGAVLARELAVATDPGRDALARALTLAPEDGRLTARLHPDDVAALADVTDLAAGRPLTVVADPAVERGGCVVEGSGATVDAQTGPALARVAAALGRRA
jgi:flagellar assembly protein FliH